MQEPARLEAMLKKKHDSNLALASRGYPFELASSGSALPFEFQLQLKPLRKYVNECRSVLNDVQINFEHLKMEPDNPSILSGIAKLLGCFCLEADSWGFNSLYDIAQALQKFILENSGRDWNDPSWEAFEKGLGTLSILVERCETDFRCRLVIDETLDCLSQAGSILGTDQV
jgi:hypothetical protein